MAALRHSLLARAGAALVARPAERLLALSRAASQAQPPDWGRVHATLEDALTEYFAIEDSAEQAYIELEPARRQGGKPEVVARYQRLALQSLHAAINQFKEKEGAAGRGDVSDGCQLAFADALKFRDTLHASLRERNERGKGRQRLA